MTGELSPVSAGERALSPLPVAQEDCFDRCGGWDTIIKVGTVFAAVIVAVILCVVFAWAVPVVIPSIVLIAGAICFAALWKGGCHQSTRLHRNLMVLPRPPVHLRAPQPPRPPVSLFAGQPRFLGAPPPPPQVVFVQPRAPHQPARPVGQFAPPGAHVAFGAGHVAPTPAVAFVPPRPPHRPAEPVEQFAPPGTRMAFGAGPAHALPMPGPHHPLSKQQQFANAYVAMMRSQQAEAPRRDNVLAYHEVGPSPHPHFVGPLQTVLNRSAAASARAQIGAGHQPPVAPLRNRVSFGSGHSPASTPSLTAARSIGLTPVALFTPPPSLTGPRNVGFGSGHLRSGIGARNV